MKRCLVLAVLSTGAAFAQPINNPVFTGVVTTPITGTVQCVRVNTQGILSGTTFDCLTGNFGQLQSGTLIGQTLTLGTGSSLVPTGTATIIATGIAGSAPASPVIGINAQRQFIVPPFRGNGGMVQLSTGVVTAGHMAIFDANGNTIDGGAPGSGNGGGGSGTASPPQWTDLNGTSPQIGCTSPTVNTATFNFGQLAADVSPTWAGNCASGATLHFQVRQAATGGPYKINWGVQFTQACNASPFPNTWTNIDGWWDAATNIFHLSSCSPDTGPAILSTMGTPPGTPADASKIWCWPSGGAGTMQCKNHDGVITTMPTPASR